MKIICTVINDLTYDQRMQRICTSLSKAGYEVVLVGRVLPSSKPFQAFPFHQKRIRNIFNKGKLFYVEYNIRLFFLLLFTKFDIICSIDLDTLLAGYATSTLKRKKLVYDAHEYFTEVPEVVQRPRTKKIWETIANFLIPKVKYAYTVGYGLSEIFTKKYNVPFDVIRNVPFEYQILDPEFISQTLIKYNLPTEQTTPVLLYQGALNDGRGISEMITAMTNISNAELWLAGEGDLSNELRELATTLQVNEKVRFLGYVLPTDLRVITSLATIGLNLLENKGLNYYYSLANKCFDYIQHEVPALHMNFPEYQAINSQYEIGVLLDDLQTDSIQQAVQKLLTDTSYYNQLVDNCKVAKRIYTWEQEEQKLVAFYEKVIHSHK